MPKADHLKQKRELQRVRRAQLNSEDTTNEQIINSESRHAAQTNTEVRGNE